MRTAATIVAAILLAIAPALAQAPKPSNYISGCASATTTAATVVIAAQGAGTLVFITNISVENTGAAASLMTIQQDPAGTPVTMWQTGTAVGGNSNIDLTTPIVTPAANKAVGFTAGTASTTQYVCLSGYKVP